jgi:hypothetical protein
MTRGEPVEFSEKQGFRQWHQPIILAFPPAALLFMTVRQIVFHKPWGSPPRSDGGLIFLTVLLTLVYIRLITVKLVTELRHGEIVVGMRGLWKRRRIRLEDIRAAEAVTYDAIRDFGGYGIRSGPRGKAYIAHGNRAVELALRDGRKIFIGSQKPAALVQQVLSARQNVKA